MNTLFNTQSLLSFITVFAGTLLMVSVWMYFSNRLGLVDKPDKRKQHARPVPVVGGLAIFSGMLMALTINSPALSFLLTHPALCAAAVVLLITGVWDDRNNLRPLYRLLIQMGCAALVAYSGIRITSFHGFLGLQELNTTGQYMLTILVITGVTNAFNLLDGLDGLAGGLGVINFAVLSLLSWQAGLYELMHFCLLILVALLAFLKKNFYPARIFMGDGGSLSMGFLISTIGILLIEQAAIHPEMDAQKILVIVSGLVTIPVFDSLRVYIWRIRRGESPFKADRTHLHHLFLIFGFNHKKTTYIIYFFELVLVGLGFLFQNIAANTIGLFIIAALFLGVGQLLQINSSVVTWSDKIRKMEEAAK